MRQARLHHVPTTADSSLRGTRLCMQAIVAATAAERSALQSDSACVVLQDRYLAMRMAAARRRLAAMTALPLEPRPPMDDLRAEPCLAVIGILPPLLPLRPADDRPSTIAG